MEDLCSTWPKLSLQNADDDYDDDADGVEGVVEVDDDDFSLIIDDNEKIHALENNDDEKFKMMSTICTSRSLLIRNVLLEHSKLEQALLLGGHDKVVSLLLVVDDVLQVCPGLCCHLLQW